MQGYDDIHMSLWNVQVRNEAVQVGERTFDVTEDVGRRSSGLAVHNGLF